jgi:hypothetical protein
LRRWLNVPGMSAGWIAFWSTVGAVALAAVVEEIVRCVHRGGDRRQDADKDARAALTAYVVALATANDWLRKHVGAVGDNDLLAADNVRMQAYSRWDEAKVVVDDPTALPIIDAAMQQTESVFEAIRTQRRVSGDVGLEAVRDDVRALITKFR